MIPPNIILASSSPRRSELLASLGLRFSTVTSKAQELHGDEFPLADLCRKNAALKAEEVATQYPDSLVIGADTLVALRGQVFGKPRDEADARRMLTELSGQTHEVVTGVCFHLNGRPDSFFDRTEVLFRPLTAALIEDYLARVHVLDKAGAYGIQELGRMLIERIEGSYSNVMGLPIEMLSKRLEGLGYSVTTNR